MKKKLLVFHPALPPYRVDFFNSLHQAYNASFYFFNKNLLNQKFDLREILNKTEFQIHYLTKGINFRKRSIRFGIYKILKNEKPEIIICSEFSPIIMLISLYRSFKKKNFLIHTLCDDNITMAAHPKVTKRIIRGIVLRHLDGIILTNAQTGDWYATKTNLRISVFPIIRKEVYFRRELSYSVPLAQKYLDEYSLNSKRIFLFVGRLAKEKNLECLIDAFKTIHENYSDVRLAIVGSGYMEKKLVEKVHNYGLDDAIIFTGRLERNELLAWYVISGVFILPSTSELFGAVINEALLAGCYTLVSNVAGGVSLIKDGVNGSLIEPVDVWNIADKMLDCLNNDSLFSNQGELRSSRMLVNYDDAIRSLVNNLH